MQIKNERDSKITNEIRHEKEESAWSALEENGLVAQKIQKETAFR